MKLKITYFMIFLGMHAFEFSPLIENRLRRLWIRDTRGHIACIEIETFPHGDAHYNLCAHESWRYQGKTLREWRDQFSSDKECLNFFEKKYK